MKVLVAFEFDGVDPNSPEADKIVAEITESCETMRIGFDATECWVDDAVGSKGPTVYRFERVDIHYIEIEADSIEEAEAEVRDLSCMDDRVETTQGWWQVLSTNEEGEQA
jgi:hypothetical protein